MGLFPSRCAATTSLPPTSSCHHDSPTPSRTWLSWCGPSQTPTPPPELCLTLIHRPGAFDTRWAREMRGKREKMTHWWAGPMHHQKIRDEVHCWSWWPFLGSWNREGTPIWPLRAWKYGLLLEMLLEITLVEHKFCSRDHVQWPKFLEQIQEWIILYTTKTYTIYVHGTLVRWRSSLNKSSINVSLRWIHIQTSWYSGMTRNSKVE